MKSLICSQANYSTCFVCVIFVCHKSVQFLAKTDSFKICDYALTVPLVSPIVATCNDILKRLCEEWSYNNKIYDFVWSSLI